MAVFPEFSQNFKFYFSGIEEFESSSRLASIFRSHFISFLVGIIALEPSFNNETILKV